MTVHLPPSNPHGKIKAIASKSVAHRLLICSAFADAPSRIRCEETNRDIDATASCLRALGADITYSAPYFEVCPIMTPSSEAIMECDESGSTLRFLLPIVAALGVKTSFHMKGRLPERPLSPLYELLSENGCSLSPQGEDPLVCEGRLSGNSYSIRGDVSSQFISGMLFAMALSCRGGTLRLTGKVESLPYINMTVDALSLFGAECKFKNSAFYVTPAKKIVSPGEIRVEGDWSNAAFPLCMGALSQSAVEVTGLNLSSHQGDRAILDCLRLFGASITEKEDSVTVKGSNPLVGISVNAANIPDLVPIIATVASVASGETVITGASRLRIKESDRLASVTEMLTAIGADIKETNDGLIIRGKHRLRGGRVSSHNDHRIAMSAAVASAICEDEVTVVGAEATSKSYPAFWEDIEKLSVIVLK